MRREILMPPLTPAMVDGKVSRWHVSEGQDVVAGDVLVEIATASATLEIEADAAGQVERILVPAGTEGVKVNTPIAIVMPAAAPSVTAQPLGFAALGAFAAAPFEEPAFAKGSGARTYREALRDAIGDAMRADGDVFLAGVDVAQNRGALKVAQGLADAFGPQRVVSVAAADDAFFGFAVGAAMAGLRPIVEVASWGRALEVMMPHLIEAAETFYLSGGRLAVPVVIRGPNGFSPGATGQEARCVAGLLAQIPGLAIAQPATADAAYDLLAAAIRHPGPVCVLEHEQLYGAYALPGAAEHASAALGVARVVRAGVDVTLAASGHAVVTALDAAERLVADGVDAEVIDLMSVRPLDVAAVAGSVRRTGRLVTVEEGWGLGAELAAAITERCFDVLKAPPQRMAGAEIPMPYAGPLQALAVPRAIEVRDAVLAAVRAA